MQLLKFLGGLFRTDIAPADLALVIGTSAVLLGSLYGAVFHGLAILLFVTLACSYAMVRLCRVRA